MIGRTLGPYRIEEKLGEGGMGAVYKARDTRLGRTVALKVVAGPAATDTAARDRFMREAQAIASLNHPHICALHDVGHEGDVDFLVMEHLEGETLEARLRRGPVPIDQVLDIGWQLADALAKAHRLGFVHRDLKPSNVMLLRGGTTPHAKLLDFGLAKFVPRAAAVVSVLPTQQVQTRPGTILGTVPYMAPEQLEGKETDARVDLFALGCLLFEMVTARRAFGGESEASVISAIMTSDPPAVSSVQPGTPPALDRLIRRCLAKDPDARWQSAVDVTDELRWLAAGSGAASGVLVAPVGAGRRFRWRTALAFAGAILAGVVAGALFWHPASAPVQPAARPMRFVIALPADKPLAPAGLVSPGHDRPALALSHEGTRLAYVALIHDHTQICLRNMQTGEVRPLDGTDGGHTPFFSPDDEWLGFFADNKLKKIPSAGGNVSVLADAPYPWGGTWGTDGNIYFNRYEGEGVFRVDGSGAVQPVSDDGMMPEFVKAGPGLLVSLGNLRYIDLAKPSVSRVLTRGDRAQSLSMGVVIYSSGDELIASRFNASAGEFDPSPVTLSKGVRWANYGVAQFTASDSGTVVWAEGRPQGLTSFTWVDRNGKSEPAGLPEGQYGPYALSPDGARLCYGLGGELHVWDWARGVSERLTPRAGEGKERSAYPRWTPDGKAILYQSTRAGGDARLMAAVVDRSAPPAELWVAKAPRWRRGLYPMSLSRDGATLCFFSTTTETSFDLWLMPLDGSHPPVRRGEPSLFLGTKFGECFGRISPDGRWIVFSSDSSGAYEIWATTYPQAGPTYKLSDDGGREAMFNPARPGEVVYMNGRAMYAVDVRQGPDRARKPVFLFDGPYPDVPGFSYDMASDGRFLMLQNPDILKPVTTLQVVTNVGEALNARLR